MNGYTPNEPLMQLAWWSSPRLRHSHDAPNHPREKPLRLARSGRRIPITTTDPKPAFTQQDGQPDHPAAPRHALSVPPSLNSPGANPHNCRHFRQPHAEPPDQLNQLERRIACVTTRPPPNASQHPHVDRRRQLFCIVSGGEGNQGALEGGSSAPGSIQVTGTAGHVRLHTMKTYSPAIEASPTRKTTAARRTASPRPSTGSGMHRMAHAARLSPEIDFRGGPGTGREPASQFA